MAYLARYAHVAPSEFGRLTPARTRAMAEHIERLRHDDWQRYAELAVIMRGSGR